MYDAISCFFFISFLDAINKSPIRSMLPISTIHELPEAIASKHTFPSLLNH